MKLFAIIISIFILFLGCAKEKPQIIEMPQQQPVQKIEITPPEPIAIPTYVYLSKDRRDPFMALIMPKKEKAPESEPKPTDRKAEQKFEVDISTLKLSGLLWDEAECLALLHDSNGFGFILRKNRLYGANFEPIKDIYGFVRGKKEVVLVQGTNQVTLKLQETPKAPLEEKGG